MKELIKITENENQEKIVSARDLHEFLESKDRFSKWFDRMLDYGFIKDQDFTSVGKFTLVNNGAKREIQDYHLKMDMAKELSMLARNEKGKEARKYFIACEKKLYQPQQLSRMDILEIAMESEKEVLKLKIETEKQQKLLTTQKPKVAFFDDAMDSQTLIDLNDVAKTLLIKDENGKLLGRNLLYQKLREMGVLNSNNKPYQSFIASNHFRLVERSYTHPKTGETVLYFKTLLTQKGVTYLHKKFKLTE